MDDAELRALRDQIDALSAPDKLRLAADLLENKRPQMAHSIAERVVVELGAAMATRLVTTEESKLVCPDCHEQRCLCVEKEPS